MSERAALSSGLSPSAASARIEDDLHAWFVQQAAVLRAQRADALDWDNVAEELEAMAARERRELVSRLKILLAHLLKWAWQPAKRSSSWAESIDEAREQISDLIEDSPSLEREIEKLLPVAYERARRKAGRDMGLSQREWDKALPKSCPWSVGEARDEEFWPQSSRRR